MDERRNGCQVLNFSVTVKSKDRMNHEELDDLLSRHKAADNPLRMPEGYLDSLEDRLMARIAAEEQAQEAPRRPVWRILKPALTLAAMFALIFGMGYGVLSLTHTANRSVKADPEAGYASVVDEWIRPASLINYYEMDSQAVEDELDEETLVNYLASELSFAELAEIYAQAYQK